MNSKKIIASVVVILELYLLLTSSWGSQAFAGVEIDKIGFPFEWGPAIISALVILIFTIREKEHPLASLVLVGSFLIFLVRAKVFGVSGVENLEAIGDVTVELTTQYWIMFVISIVLFVLSGIGGQKKTSDSSQVAESNTNEIS
jgi:hypothetical protein